MDSRFWNFRQINNKTKNIYFIVIDEAYIRIVASNHFSIWHLMAQTVCGLVGVHWHVQDIWWVHWQQWLLKISTRKMGKGKKVGYITLWIYLWCNKRIINAGKKSISHVLLIINNFLNLFFIFFFLGESSSEHFLPLPLDPRLSLSPLLPPPPSRREIKQSHYIWGDKHTVHG